MTQSKNMKCELSIELRAGDVLVAVSTNARLWGDVLGAILLESQQMQFPTDHQLQKEPSP